MIGAGEALVLAAVVAVLYCLLGPLRRRLEVCIGRHLHRGGSAVVASSWSNGAGTAPFTREDRHDG